MVQSITDNPESLKRMAMITTTINYLVFHLRESTRNKNFYSFLKQWVEKPHRNTYSEINEILSGYEIKKLNHLRKKILYLLRELWDSIERGEIGVIDYVIESFSQENGLQWFDDESVNGFFIFLEKSNKRLEFQLPHFRIKCTRLVFLRVSDEKIYTLNDYGKSKLSRILQRLQIGDTVQFKNIFIHPIQGQIRLSNSSQLININTVTIYKIRSLRKKLIDFNRLWYGNYPQFFSSNPSGEFFAQYCLATGRLLIQSTKIHVISGRKVIFGFLSDGSVRRGIKIKIPLDLLGSNIQKLISREIFVDILIRRSIFTYKFINSGGMADDVIEMREISEQEHRYFHSLGYLSLRRNIEFESLLTNLEISKDELRSLCLQLETNEDAIIKDKKIHFLPLLSIFRSQFKSDFVTDTNTTAKTIFDFNIQTFKDLFSITKELIDPQPTNLRPEFPKSENESSSNGISNQWTVKKVKKHKNIFLPIGGGDEIGASSYFLQIQGYNILIDAGMRIHGDRRFPNYNILWKHIDGIPDIDLVLITHAHLDHWGAIPKIYEYARNAEIVTTSATKRIIEVMLRDSVSITKKEFPGDIYIHEYQGNLVKKALSAITEVDFNRPYVYGNEQIPRITFFHAGHILGAASILLEFPDWTILFTGDYSVQSQFTVGPSELPLNRRLDAIVSESTYSQPSQIVSRNKQQIELISRIKVIIENKGTVLIPAFAVGRSQEVIMLIKNALEKKLLPHVPVYVDGLVKAVCDIYDEFRADSLDKMEPKPSLFFNDNITKAYSKIESTEFNGRCQGPAIIISSSGMLAEKSRSSYYAQNILREKGNALFFTGYVDEESPGRKLMNMNKSQKDWILLNEEKVKINAKVEPFYLSAHASCTEIVDQLRHLQSGQIIFVHGTKTWETPNILTLLMEEYKNRSVGILKSKNGLPIYM